MGPRDAMAISALLSDGHEQGSAPVQTKWDPRRDPDADVVSQALEDVPKRYSAECIERFDKVLAADETRSFEQLSSFVGQRARALDSTATIAEAYAWLMLQERAESRVVKIQALTASASTRRRRAAREAARKEALKAAKKNGHGNGSGATIKADADIGSSDVPDEPESTKKPKNAAIAPANGSTTKRKRPIAAKPAKIEPKEPKPTKEPKEKEAKLGRPKKAKEPKEPKEKEPRGGRKRKAEQQVPETEPTLTRAAKRAKEAKEAKQAKEAAAREAREAKEKEAKEKASKKTEERKTKQYWNVYEGLWRDIARKEVPKAWKVYQSAQAVKLSNARKTATLAAKEARKWQVLSNRHIKDMQTKARRAMREMMAFWKRNEREERDSRRKAEKEALESARKDEEDRESRRQARKLNFLLTQTELYSHFVGSKASESGNETAPPAEVDFDAADDSELHAAAAAQAQEAVAAARARAAEFGPSGADEELNFQNPTSLKDGEVLPQPKLLQCQLKEYQLKGLTWLANLYEQGINGILADEMGLGKTVQSISVLSYLAETHNIWGPFLVIAPASTLHNWQQEITKFVPEFKVLPYWGSNKDRKVLRKFWDRQQLRYTRESPFHVLVTSYQLVVADAQYFNRIKWQYMILDEAQAIKSSSSSRWKSLLSMQCRNRLLLTGTPIQNSMQELWALLHFIMPTLFDSHEEFSDWFSKDIESHATKNSQLNEAQLKRLHMILKPFMLRRVKKHVQQELGDKIEIDLYCDLTHRQKMLYRLLKSQISLRDLIERTLSSGNGGGDDSASLMNLVMQFRKVCNHPDLFERADVRSALGFSTFGSSSDMVRDQHPNVASSQRNLVDYELPKLVYRDGGLLDVPCDANDNFVRNKILKRLTIADDPTAPYVQTISKFSGTPAGEIVREARRGLFERATNLNAPEPLKFIKDDLLGNYVQDNYLEVFEPAFQEPVVAPPILWTVSDRSAEIGQAIKLATPASLFPLSLNQEWSLIKSGAPMPPSNQCPVVPGNRGFSTISVPSMTRFISESGKLAKLDQLLVDLKRGGHRVLVYFQMTRMMDLMEDYLTYRQYKYLRLDGSSKLSDRRDVVNDWQTKPELFVFLLSTRAGGLGINLTAADTVVFYDSDWNPTIDSQAMDRAHRLGQTRQVTVYRLLTRGTIEERMRDRAKQKEHVQKVVMEGGRSAPPAPSKPGSSEVAYWLLDDDKAVEDAVAKAKAQKKRK